MNLLKRLPRGSAVLVGAGIFLSRIAGLLREKVFAYYLGSSSAADVFRAALRIPNLLQNLLGEGVLSGSFIPVYSRLIAEGREPEARKLAGSVLGVLGALTLLIVTGGMLVTPYLIDLIAFGFTGERRELCITVVRILFPGLGFLVLSAYCLGVLNSHRKFFLSYAAPVLWNLAIIAALIYGGLKLSLPIGDHVEKTARLQNQLVVITASGVAAGCLLQLIVQVPTVVTLLCGVPIHFSREMFQQGSHFRKVVKNFLPIVTGKGVVQISAYIDTMLASSLPIGALSCLGYAQTLYLLPVSLFGMSISAAELPAMSQALGTETEVAGILKNRIRSACRKIAFFIIPSACAFIFLAPFILLILFRGGAFTPETSNMVWYVLVGSSVGLLATTQGRVLSSAFYALRDAKTPLRIALIRVVVSTVLGAAFAFYGPGILGIDKIYGTVGLTAGFGISGWAEWWLLKRKLEGKIGKITTNHSYQAKLWFCALLPALDGFIILQWYCPQLLHSHSGRGVTVGDMATSFLVLGIYGVAYLGLAMLLKIPETQLITRMLSKHKP